MPPIQWYCRPFDILSPAELYGIMALRQVVFILEQHILYLDADGKDSHSLHLCGYDADGGLAAYARLLPKGVSYSDYASIGRVVTAPFARGKGLGRPLMREAIAQLYQAWGVQPIKISAQYHLRDYYGSLGFHAMGEVYDEDGIPHIAMVLDGVL